MTLAAYGYTPLRTFMKRIHFLVLYINTNNNIPKEAIDSPQDMPCGLQRIAHDGDLGMHAVVGELNALGVAS